MDFVAIDFETANNRRNSACAVAIMVVEKKKIVHSEEWLIRPPTLEFSGINMEIHGITPADVENKPRFDIVWGEMKKYFENKPIIAHNVPFDRKVLSETLKYYQLPLPEFEYFCTLKISKSLWPHLSSHSLSTVAAYLKNSS